ncbi:MAG: hypothetical protein K0R10_744 [Alphaproteobacteria bacterium]|nr:hypothetical protein [Alphaproteobacteria bacterium]
MVLSNGLFISKVAHTRMRPKRNSFWYGVYYLSFPLDEMKRLAECALLSVNRGNLFSFHENDHATGGLAIESWARKVLADWQVPQADGRVVLVTLPRLFGYVFNPVSFFFCLDKAGALRAVISEVHNTFGDVHSYICFHDDRRPITQDDFMQADKKLHVSPFIKVEGHYVFRFAYGEEKLGVWIDHHDADDLKSFPSSIIRRFACGSWAINTSNGRPRRKQRCQNENTSQCAVRTPAAGFVPYTIREHRHHDA